MQTTPHLPCLRSTKKRINITVLALPGVSSKHGPGEPRMWQRTSRRGAHVAAHIKSFTWSDSREPAALHLEAGHARNSPTCFGMPVFLLGAITYPV
eukprot:scaffold40081_cov32-Tisochrysis_lutea.AAC.3